MSRAHKFSIELALDDPELELVVEGNATPYDPGVCSGPPESCYPPEGGEVEIENVYATHCGTTKPVECVRLEISPLIAKLEALDKLQELTEQALANRKSDEPDYSDYED